MSDEIKDTTVPSTKPDGSMLFGISSRAVIAILLVLTVCIMSALGIPIVEPIYTLVLTVVAFYFGHIQGSNKK